MRFLPFLLALCLITAPAGAGAPEAPALPSVDWVSVESAGTLGTGTSGGFDKTLWQGQKRSDIEYVLARAPTRFDTRSVLSMQRRLLLSTSNSALIQNDIGPLRGNDLFIQRIRKLMDMGLYDDAWELYTQKAEDPYDVSVAQLGMLLMIMRADLATACLEEKVFAARYPQDAFFKTLDKACAKTLGVNASPSFPDSAALQATYNDPGYSVAAASYETLAKMNDLERALVLANGKIRYDGLSRAILAKTPSSLVSLYLLDRALPEQASAMIVAELIGRGIAPYMSSVYKAPQWRKLRDTKLAEDRWPLIVALLNDSAHAPGDLFPLTGFLNTAEPTDLSTELVTKVLGVFLAAGETLPDFWLEAARKRMNEKPIITIYLQAFDSLTPTKIPSFTPEQLGKAFGVMKAQDIDQTLAIIGTLDKDAPIQSLLLKAYDNHLGLTLQNNYVMPNIGLNILLETAPEFKQTGITVLAVTNSLAASPDNMYSGSVRKALYSLLNVGLLEDARTIGSEIVASVLNKY